MPIVTSLTSNGVFQTIGSLGSFDEISLDSGSINFNGTNQYLAVPASSRFSLTGDFTVEAWVWIDSTIVTSSPDNLKNFSIFSGTGTFSGTMVFAVSGNTVTAGTGLAIYQDSPSVNLSQSVTVPLNSWVHIAFIRSGSTIYGFLNGTRYTLGTSSSTLIDPFNAVAVGRNQNTSYFNYAKGYISNHRVVNGTAVYIDNFTPPTAPLTPVANTVLLLTTSPQSPFSDSSSNNFTITKINNPGFNTLGPFYYPGNTSINLANTNNNPVLGSNTNIITSTTSNGVVMVTGEFDEVSMTSQSLQFDGSTGYLSVPYSSNFEFGNGNFTIEFWMYSSGISSQGLMSFPHNASNYGQALFFGGSGSGLTFYSSSDGINWDVANASSLGNINLNAWNHIAVSKSGSSIRTFLNGVLQATITFAGTFAGTYDRCWIGDTSLNSNYNGLFSNIRVVKGTALYTANFTPPTTALTAVANTVLLLNNFEAQPFVDNSSNNLTITVNGGVTANTFTPFANTQRKILNTGTMMVREFDEYSMNAFAATGGNVTTSGAYTVHTFTANGTFQVTTGSKDVEYLVVAGGGGGGTNGGGGGAGGFITSSLLVTTQSYAVTVGVGGAGGLASGTASGSDGTASSVFGVTAIGGGGGGGGNQNSNTNFSSGRTGGSGGGGAAWFGNGLAGANTAGQGSNGGSGVDVSPYMHGGGGGASQTGQIGGTVASTGGKGGDGLSSSISGSSVFYAGGGGGGTNFPGTGGAGGLGGGGAGVGTSTGTAGFAATANTGGGGGGGSGNASSPGVGGAGGSGIVIIRYLT
jgi:hypothetical protein